MTRAETPPGVGHPERDGLEDPRSICSLETSSEVIYTDRRTFRTESIYDGAAMATPRTGELPAGMAVLGLLVQRPDTVAGVGLRLEQEYPAARWPRNIVHNTLPSLLDRRLVMVAKRGSERSLDRYEPTEAGEERFAEWMRESSAVLPSVRDAMRAKLRYIECEDQLASIVQDIREQEDLCVGEGEKAMLRYRRAQRSGRLGALDGSDWRPRVRRALMLDEVSFWHQRAHALQRLREYLEDPCGEHDALVAP